MRATVRKALFATACVFACLPTLTPAQSLRTEEVAAGLENPWAVAFLPQGRYLVTERPGRMRIIDAGGKIDAPLAGLPEVAAGEQGGLPQ